MEVSRGMHAVTFEMVTFQQERRANRLLAKAHLNASIPYVGIDKMKRAIEVDREEDRPTL